jgi:hypothetical protein
MTAPTLFDVTEIQVTEIKKKKITKIELNNEDSQNRYAKLQLSEVTTRNGAVTSINLVKELIEKYDEQTAEDSVYQLKHPETDEILGEATYTEFLLHIYSFSMHVADREAAKILAEQAQMAQMQENMAKQAALQRRREALAEEQRLERELLEAELNANS